LRNQRERGDKRDNCSRPTSRRIWIKKVSYPGRRTHHLRPEDIVVEMQSFPPEPALAAKNFPPPNGKMSRRGEVVVGDGIGVAALVAGVRLEAEAGDAIYFCRGRPVGVARVAR